MRASRSRARLAFVLISKLYRQMYANTGIATDSARTARSAKWARMLAQSVPPALRRHADAGPAGAGLAAPRRVTRRPAPRPARPLALGSANSRGQPAPPEVCHADIPVRRVPARVPRPPCARSDRGDVPIRPGPPSRSRPPATRQPEVTRLRTLPDVRADPAAARLDGPRRRRDSDGWRGGSTARAGRATNC